MSQTSERFVPDALKAFNAKIHIAHDKSWVLCSSNNEGRWRRGEGRGRGEGEGGREGRGRLEGEMGGGWSPLISLSCQISVPVSNSVLVRLLKT